VLTPSGAEIENTISWAEDSVNLVEKCDAGVYMAEATDITFREKVLPQCQAIDEFPRNARSPSRLTYQFASV
jgi:hypothetical protein